MEGRVRAVGEGRGSGACVKPPSRYILGLVSSVIRLFRASSGVDREGSFSVPRVGQPRLVAAAVKSMAARRLSNKSPEAALGPCCCRCCR